MTAKILDGRAIAQGIRQNLKQHIQQRSLDGHAQPGLDVILVGNNPASATYVKHKQRYCEDGRYLIDNNHTEREIKPFVIARKNFLFAGSQEGARALCLHFSLIRSAKLHKLDPYLYYVEIMKAIPSCKTAEDYEALLPWNIDLAKVTTAYQ